MTTLLIVSVVALALLIVSCFAVKRYRLGRSHGKAVTDDALRELYGQYWAQVRTVTQTRALKEPADEEWLSGIRERALYAGISGRESDKSVRHRPRRTTLLRWLAGVAGVLLVAALVFCSVHLTTGAVYLILAFFLSGVVLGAASMVAIMVRREDRRYSLSGPAPGAAARGARLLTRFGGAGAHYRPRGWMKR
jgi:hypothetical protein